MEGAGGLKSGLLPFVQQRKPVTIRRTTQILLYVRRASHMFFSH
jgi:hypothetical protein